MVSTNKTLKLIAKSIPPIFFMQNNTFGGVIGEILQLIVNNFAYKIEIINEKNNNETDVDLYIGYNYDELLNIQRVWFHQQSIHCLVYGNSYKINEFTSFQSDIDPTTYLLYALPTTMTWIFIMCSLKIIHKFKLAAAAGRAFVYAMQIHTGGSCNNSHIYMNSYGGKLYLMVSYFVNLIICCQITAVLALELTVPKHNLTSDLVQGAEKPESFRLYEDVGVGTTCFRELVKGEFVQRICLEECSLIKSKQETKDGLTIIGSPINFRDILLVSDKYPYLNDVKLAVRRFNEMGLYEKNIRSLHQMSYKRLLYSKQEIKLKYDTTGRLLVNILFTPAMASTFIFTMEYLKHILDGSTINK